MKCEIVTQLWPANPVLNGNSYNMTFMSCRAHGLTFQGMMPIKDNMCPIARIERLEKLCGQS